MRRSRAKVTLLAALATVAVLCIPAVAAAAPAKEEYRLKYPDATGKGSGGGGGGGSTDGTFNGVGPRGASAKGFSGKDLKGGSGKGANAGKGGFAGATSGKADTDEVPGTTAGTTSETVPQVAADQAGLGGLPVLLFILGITSAGAIGFAGWRRLRHE